MPNEPFMPFTLTSKKILVIEDNADIANLLMLNLRGKNMQVDLVVDGSVGLSKALSGDYHLVILDLMLPGMDGMDICRVMRNKNNFTPILMLTAKSSELDRVLGLEVGADDYLTKPFSVPELVARVNAIFRRSEQYLSRAATGQNAAESEQLEFDGLSVDAVTRKVTLGDTAIELTAKEFDLLWYFASHPGRVFTRAQLLDSVWGYGHDGYEHTVNSHINRLRAKIEIDSAKPQYVVTVWGVGYKFSPAETGLSGR